jgi:hypothetical protein
LGPIYGTPATRLPVVALTAAVAGVVIETMTSGCRSTSCCARMGNWSGLARRSASQWQDSFPRHKPGLEAVCEKSRIREGGFSWPASTPIRRMGSGCCARAANGHAITGSTEQRNELAAPHHSITSSASCLRCSGTSRPSALAVFKLITSSNLPVAQQLDPRQGLALRSVWALSAGRAGHFSARYIYQ